MNIRPEYPQLNYGHSFANGLMFGGLLPSRFVGTTWFHDSSLYGNHGTLTNMDPATDWVFDPYLKRWVLDLDGSNDYISIPVAPVAAADPITVSCWWKAPVWNSPWGTFAESSAGAGAGLYFGGMFTGSLYFARKTNNNVVWNTTGISLSGWHHYCFTHTGGTGTGTVYFDGVQKAQTASLGSDALPGINIGKYSTIYVAGQCSDFLVHNRLLSRSEIQQLADPSNVMLSGLILPPKRKFYPVVSTPTPPLVITGRKFVPTHLWYHII